MTAVVFRVSLLLVCLVSGALSGPGFTSGLAGWAAGVAAGLAVFGAIWWLERIAARTVPQVLVGTVGGVLLGLLGAVLARRAAGFGLLPAPAALGWSATLAYLGAVAGARCARSVGSVGAGLGGSPASMLLDTSAIIDGRVVDMLELGFVRGPFVVPQFVLNELQGIADSPDSLRRARGRRGLSILERLQRIEGVDVRIPDRDFPSLKAVDAKIVALAKAMEATVVTNDFNLTKVAELQGLRVLNIHQLSRALRPVVLPGEEVEITIQKPGKEQGQGVGYLEDGTMVVVDGGSDRLGGSVRTIVTSVLQTTAGRMIFSKLPDDAGGSDPSEKQDAWKGLS